MKLNKREIRKIWRTKYPWIFVVYILLIGLLRGVLDGQNYDFSMNLMMVAAFVSYIFLYLFYLYGVRPDELNYWHNKYKK
ncbi:MAG: hypothetical protein ACQER9_03015 [Nanobdellota archaeon]